ncbi:adenosylcobinamide-GDP ribazoletransferase, partial [Klebsiella pneumoniae]|uniref:adenosylcobinamide-GDP ribazoletransferase n=1 Tax=Klebsiella pneumoniae TaxID=573 RepID=UPI001954367E
TTSIIVTGALHEDGLADAADGFYGGKTSARIVSFSSSMTCSRSAKPAAGARHSMPPDGLCVLSAKAYRTCIDNLP